MSPAEKQIELSVLLEKAANGHLSALESKRAREISATLRDTHIGEKIREAIMSSAAQYGPGPRLDSRDRDDLKRFMGMVNWAWIGGEAVKAVSGIVDVTIGSDDDG